MGRASLLLRLSVYRERETYTRTPAQRHAGLERHTNTKWLHVESAIYWEDEDDKIHTHTAATKGRCAGVMQEVMHGTVCRHPGCGIISSYL